MLYTYIDPLYELMMVYSIHLTQLIVCHYQTVHHTPAKISQQYHVECHIWISYAIFTYLSILASSTISCHMRFHTRCCGVQYVSSRLFEQHGGNSKNAGTGYTQRAHVFSPSFCLGSCCSFLVFCVICFVCLRPVSCVSNVNNISRLSILIAPWVFSNVYLHRSSNSGAGIAYHSAAPEFILGFLLGWCCSNFSFLF